MKWAGILGCVGLMAGMTVTYGQTIWTGIAEADAFVTTGPTGDLVANNYGAAGALAVSGADATRSGSGFRGLFESVLRFDLASAKGAFDLSFGAGLWAVESITLQLVTTTPNNAIFNDNSTGQIEIVWMENDAWDAGTGNPNAPSLTGITYQSLPGFLGADDQVLGTFDFNVTSSGADGSFSTYLLALESGILEDIASGGLASLNITAATDGVSYLFNSANFSNANRRPVLTIEVVAIPELSTWILLLAGWLCLMVVGKLRNAGAR